MGITKIKNLWSCLRASCWTENITGGRKFQGIENLEIELRNCRIKWKVTMRKERKENINRCWRWWGFTKRTLLSSIESVKSKGRRLSTKQKTCMRREKKMKIKLKISKQNSDWSSWRKMIIISILMSSRRQKILRSMSCSARPTDF